MLGDAAIDDSRQPTLSLDSVAASWAFDASPEHLLSGRMRSLIRNSYSEKGGRFRNNSPLLSALITLSASRSVAREEHDDVTVNRSKMLSVLFVGLLSTAQT